jgi:hypothetical protein
VDTDTDDHSTTIRTSTDCSVIFAETTDFANDIIVIEMQSGIATSLLPFSTFGPSSAVALLHAIESAGEFFESDLKGGTFILKGVLLVLKLGDVLVGTLKNSAFILLGSGDDLGNVFNSFVDDFAAAAFNCVGMLVGDNRRIWAVTRA